MRTVAMMGLANGMSTNQASVKFPIKICHLSLTVTQCTGLSSQYLRSFHRHRRKFCWNTLQGGECGRVCRITVVDCLVEVVRANVASVFIHAIRIHEQFGECRQGRNHCCSDDLLKVSRCTSEERIGQNHKREELLTGEVMALPLKSCIFASVRYDKSMRLIGRPCKVRASRPLMTRPAEVHHGIPVGVKHGTMPLAVPSTSRKTF